MARYVKILHKMGEIEIFIEYSLQVNNLLWNSNDCFGLLRGTNQ
jgi:hypothetical protein